MPMCYLEQNDVQSVSEESIHLEHFLDIFEYQKMLEHKLTIFEGAIFTTHLY